MAVKNVIRRTDTNMQAINMCAVKLASTYRLTDAIPLAILGRSPAS